MSTAEHPALPKNVSYISLDGTPATSDSPFPEIRFKTYERSDSGAPMFDYKRLVLVDHYKDHVRDLKNGKYDNRWDRASADEHRTAEINCYEKEIEYLENLKDDEAGNAYVELWYQKFDGHEVINPN